MVKAVIFDCFGVLYNDAYKEFFAAYASKMGEREGYYRNLAYKVDAGLIDDEFFYGELARVSGLPQTEIARRMNDTSGLNHNVIDIVRHLKPKYKIGLLSNSERHFLQRFLDNGNIGHLFDTVIASSETGMAKPEPQIFKLASAKLGVEPQEVVFIDDGEHNVRAAAGVGMRAVLYESATQLSTDLKNLGLAH